MREPKFNFTFGVNKNIMKTLISMTDFIMNVEIYNDYRADDFAVCYNYASFLKQPLNLEMFVPCDDEGNVLEIPQYFEFHQPTETDVKKREFYQKAKEKVLFEGFYVHHNVLFYPNQVEFYNVEESAKFGWMDIEWLLQNSFQELQLTRTALKQIGL